MNVADERWTPSGKRRAAAFERARLFLSEVRNELKRVTWPSQEEVYATTVVVIADVGVLRRSISSRSTSGC